jgi:hypothetical protein
MSDTIQFDMSVIAPLQVQLEKHPVYDALQDIEDLRIFMQHHIYSVWDFMSMIKALQATIAPARVPWVPVGNASVRHFINSLVLEEESDEALPTADGRPQYSSHFELYCQTMREIGTDPQPALGFLDIVMNRGIGAALDAGIAPAPSEAFMRTTFGFIDTGKPHVVAAALALGREHVIPGMFRRFLAHMAISEQQAPAFHYYLNRHIHLDEDFHGPLSLKMLEELCEGDCQRMTEAEQTAVAALQARIQFWDGVNDAIKHR